MTPLGRATAAVAAAGLAVRGAFHPASDDAVPALQNGAAPGTLVLVGMTGRWQWPIFAASPEAADGRTGPLDRWSRRVIGALAAKLGASPLYPFGAPPFLPFQRWAVKAEPVHRSAIGILIHPQWGLWHSYRGALAFADSWVLPARAEDGPSPCDGCDAKPCLAACPVGAFSPGRYDVEACADHLRGAGVDCLDNGCRARRACPVGAVHRFEAVQSAFHMRAFRASRC